MYLSTQSIPNAYAIKLHQGQSRGFQSYFSVHNSSLFSSLWPPKPNILPIPPKLINGPVASGQPPALKERSRFRTLRPVTSLAQLVRDSSRREAYGYFFPPFSTLGSQVQRSLSGMGSMMLGTCSPQPHQVALSVPG